jgi:hypothetical protein
MKEQNKRRKAFLSVAGIRSGRSRYAPEVQSGILSAEEAAGIQRLKELDNEEIQLIAQAEAANEDAQFKLLYEKMAQAKAIRQEKNDIAQRLFDNAIKLDQLNIEKAEEARAAMEATTALFDEAEKAATEKLETMIDNKGLPGLSDAELLNWSKKTGIPVSALMEMKEVMTKGEVDSKIVGSMTEGFAVVTTNEDGTSSVEYLTGPLYIKPESLEDGKIIDPDTGIPYSATEIKDLRNKRYESQNLLRLINRYESLLKDEGFVTRGIGGDKEALGRMRTLRKLMTASYKQATALGALDEGVLLLVDGIIGEAPETSTAFSLYNIGGRKSKTVLAQIDEFKQDTQYSLNEYNRRLGIDDRYGGPEVGGGTSLSEEDSGEVDDMFRSAGIEVENATSTEEAAFDPLSWYDEEEEM